MGSLVSIIMPVFNTGAYLEDAIASVLDQHADGAVALPDVELILVDDNSSDPATLAILDRAADDPRMRVMRNARSKGAAGARNTGIDAARGEWIGFLDSDDLWFPDSLALRWRTVLDHPEAKWVGAGFRLLKPSADASGEPAFDTAASLLGKVERQQAPAVERLERPVARFGEQCFIGIMTVLIKRDLIVQKGMFSEQLQRSEDYHLWFKCAFDQDLWLVKADVAFYRIHGASLTHGNAPRHLHEDEMIDELLHRREGRSYSDLLLRRLDFVMQDHCYFYRGQKTYSAALRTAVRWIRRRPFQLSAWKELLACSLKVG
jgi:glycosyltransferase involved in cell wall biosynthesis